MWSDRVTHFCSALAVDLVRQVGKMRQPHVSAMLAPDTVGGRFPVNPEATQIDDIKLVALPTAVNCAEMFVRFALSEWSLKVMLDEATDVVRELTAAAVEAADQRIPALITVRARVHGDRLVVEVECPCKTRPPTNLNGPNGWRAGVVAVRHGQLAWCELPLPGGMDASAVPLPRRHHRRAPVQQAREEEPPQDLRHASDVNEEVMRRILFGLNRTNDGHVEQ